MEPQHHLEESPAHGEWSTNVSNFYSKYLKINKSLESVDTLGHTGAKFANFIKAQQMGKTNLY